MVTKMFPAMGSQVLVALEAVGTIATASLEGLRASFAVWERILSRFRPDSDLSMLNRAPGDWLIVTPVLAETLDLALRGAAATDGLVTPVVLEALERAGYDRDFAALAEGTPPAPPSPRAPSCEDWRTIHVEATRGLVVRPAGLRLDLGGVAKGWAADRAVRLISRHGPALVDVGGDIAVSGPRRDGTPWVIGVQDPRGGDGDLEVLLLNAGGVATSGRDYRRWRQGDRERHHIIDPRTGEPANTDLLSVTVVAPTAAEAEIAAKAIFIQGSQAGLAWLEARPQLAGLLVCADGRVVRTPNLEKYCWRDRAATSSAGQLIQAKIL